MRCSHRIISTCHTWIERGEHALYNRMLHAYSVFSVHAHSKPNIELKDSRLGWQSVQHGTLKCVCGKSNCAHWPEFWFACQNCGSVYTS